MCDRVIARQNNIEGVGDGSAQLTIVGDTEAYVDAELFGLLAGTVDRYFAQIRRMHLVALQRQTDSLSTNPARAVEHRVGARPIHPIGKKAVELSAFFPHCRVPVPPHVVMVKKAQAVVEIGCGPGHLPIT